jgi:hypothetical protein
LAAGVSATSTVGDPLPERADLPTSLATLVGPAEGSPGDTLAPALADTPPAGPTDPEVALPAAQLGRWLIPGLLLGEGGMGRVHSATDTVLRRDVAIKRPLPSGGRRVASALVREAITLARLDHPNVVPVHALAADDEGKPVLVMKQVTGRRWSELTAEPDLDRDVSLALRVADALAFAHAQGVLHRDVKLDNVMVGAFGEVYLMDWGCACPLQDAVTQDLVGTPSYLPPEMVVPGSPLGPHTDTFLLAATLHRAVTRRPRYPGTRIAEVLAAAERGEEPPWPAELPRELGAVLARATAADPAARTPDPAAFAAELRAFLAHRDALAVLEAARANLAALRAAVDAGDPAADLRFAECRFALRSLLGSVAAPEARAALTAAVGAWVPWKLATGELAAVEAVLAELDDPAAVRWRAQWQGAVAERDRREEARRAADLDIARRERRDMAVALLGGAMLVAGASAVLRPPSSYRPVDLVGLGVLGVAVSVVAVVPFHRRILAHRASRAIASGIVWMSVVTLLHRLSAWALDEPVDAVLRADLWLMGASAGMWSLTIEPWFGLVALPYLVAAVGATLAPAAAPALFPLAACASIAVGAALFWWRAGRGGGDAGNG